MSSIYLSIHPSIHPCFLALCYLKIGLAASTASCDPPAMNVSVASAAPTIPPLTGASIKSEPLPQEPSTSPHSRSSIQLDASQAIRYTSKMRSTHCVALLLPPTAPSALDTLSATDGVIVEQSIITCGKPTGLLPLRCSCCCPS